MRISVDHRKCMASGRCIDILPEIFMQNEDGLAIVTTEHPSPDRRDLLHAAASACPSAAISIEDDGEGPDAGR